MKRFLPRALFVIILIVGGIVWFKYRPKRVPVPPERPKIFVIGLDGASWNLMNPLLSEGKLPNIKRLMDRGAYGPLQSLTPTKSPILWTSIATGKTPVKHGIGSFTAEKDGKTIPVSGTQRITKAFWNILTDYGITVGVVNWWVTWPAEEVNGFMVSDRFREKKVRDRKDLTFPSDLAMHLPEVRMSEKQFAAERQQLGLPANIHPEASSNVIDELAGQYKGYWVQDKEIHEASRYLLANRKVEVFAVVYRIVDVSSHLFWTSIDPKLIEEMRAKSSLSAEDLARMDAAFLQILAPIYMYADKMVGDFLEHADSNTNIIVCSDHGFKFEQGRYGHSNMDTPPDGIVILSGPMFRPGVQLKSASLLDITPTLLYMEGVPLGRDMDGKPLFAAFHPEYVKTHPPRIVASLDKGFRQKGEPVSSEMDEDMLQDLKALGYIQ